MLINKANLCNTHVLENAGACSFKCGIINMVFIPNVVWFAMANYPYDINILPATTCIYSYLLAYWNELSLQNQLQ